MKFYYLFFFCFLLFPYILGMDSSDYTYSNSTSIELRIETLAHEIHRIEDAISKLQLQENNGTNSAAASTAQILESNSNGTIEQYQRKLEELKAQKKAFEDLKKRFEELNAELDEINSQFTQEDADTDTLLELQKQLDQQKQLAVLKLDDLYKSCEDFGINQPFILKDIAFSTQNNLLEDRIPCLYKKSLAEVTGKPEDIHNSIIQLGVANQFRAGGGGSASCAYHSIKNGILLLLALFGDPQSQPVLIDHLMSEPLIKLLFGPLTSPWRSRVIVHRKKYIIKNFIKNILLTRLPGTCKIVRTKEVSNFATIAPIKPNAEFVTGVSFFSQGQWLVFEPLEEDCGFEEAIRLAYMNLIESVAADIVRDLPIQANQTAPCEVTGKQVIDAFLSNIRMRMSKGTSIFLQDLQDAQRFGHPPYQVEYNYLCDENVIKAYFHNIEALSFIINGTVIEKSAGSTFIEYVFNSYLATGKGKYEREFDSNPGDWAEIEDLRTVIKYEEEVGLLKTLKSIYAPYITFNVGDGNQNPDGSASFKGTLVFDLGNGEHIYEEKFGEIKRRLAEPESSFAVIISFHLPGHWITLIVNKVGLHKQYIITDSINSKRINSKEIGELIALFEGVKAAELAPDEEINGKEDSESNENPASAATMPNGNAQSHNRQSRNKQGPQGSYCSIS